MVASPRDVWLAKNYKYDANRNKKFNLKEKKEQLFGKVSFFLYL